MHLLRSYFTLSRFGRLLLIQALLLVTVIGKGQEAPAADTTVAPPVAVPDIHDEEVADDEEEEEFVELPYIPTLRKVPDTSVKRLKADPAFAYANDPEYWTEIEKERKKRKPRDIDFNRPAPSMWDFSGFAGVVKLVVIIAFLALLALLLYKITGNRWPWQKAATLKDGPEEEAETLTVDELQEKIKQAVANKQFRLAVRYNYLFTLRTLDEKGWIRFQPKSTNYDYVNQVSKYDTKGIFPHLTNIYDYVWYGEFELTEEQFNLVHKDFQSYTNSIRR